MDFPQYRKLNNDLAFFKINSDRDFDEIKVVGSVVQSFHVEATKYPEILRIKDMLSLQIDGLVLCEASEYQAINQKVTFRQ